MGIRWAPRHNEWGKNGWLRAPQTRAPLAAAGVREELILVPAQRGGKEWNKKKNSRRMIQYAGEHTIWPSPGIRVKR